MNPAFWFRYDLNVLAREARSAASTSLVVVLPRLPVMAMKQVRNNNLRQRKATRYSNGDSNLTTGPNNSCRTHSSARVRCIPSFVP